MKNKLLESSRGYFYIMFFIIFQLINITSIAQNAFVVTGKVISADDNSTLPGVNIVIAGTTNGVITDIDGNYSINIPNANVTLHFSFIGYKSMNVPVNGRTKIDIKLEPEVSAIDEVVVTALGIKREEKALGYSVEKVNSEELTRVAESNVLNSLSGKVAGVAVNNTGGPGSTVSMVIRGATSLSTDNQPLFVIDGVPISSSTHNVGGFGDGNNVDYGNAISDLDPESIESVSILKGPSAAALYGTRAGNGVVIITTKKAKKGDKTKISVTSNTDFDLPSRFLNVQHQFASGYFSFTPESVGSNILPPISAKDAAGAGPECDKGYYAIQWGAPLDDNGNPMPTPIVSYPDNVKNFLNDYSLTTTNSVAVSSSNKTVNYRLGYTNMTHTGLIPNSDLHKNSYSLSASSNLWKKVTISTVINFNQSRADNRPASNRGTNPLQWAYSTPVNVDIRRLADYNSGADGGILRVSDKHENPYFLAYEVNNSFERWRVFGNITANWEISKSFSVQGRYTLNKSDEVRETKIAPGYTQEPNNGTYGISNSLGFERNMDVLLTYKKDWESFNLSVSAGGNTLYQRGSGISNSSKSGAGLIVPNLYTVQNINSATLNFYNSRYEKAINSVYAMANLGWKNIIFLDLTARNDWSSTLPAENRSYFYPSASVSVLVNDIFNFGKNVNLFKLRGGWAQVGNDTGPYHLTATYGNAGQWGDATRLGKPSGLLSPNLLPEQATSLEFGMDLNLFLNRIHFEGTYYTVDNENQILGVPLAASTGFSGVQVNAGLLESDGWEIIVGGTPIKTPDWSWDVNINFTKNKTRIKELTEGVDQIVFWGAAKVENIGYVEGYKRKIPKGGDVWSEIVEDGLVGNLYSKDIKRVTDKDSPYYGYPILGTGLDTEWQSEDEYSKIGNYNPDFIMGLQTTLKYKNFSLNMTFDWRSGGQYVSQTYRYLSESVSTQTWLDQLVNPGQYGGGPSPELRQWVIDNADRLLLSDDLHPVGGPTPEYGGFPEGFSGYTVYDGTFSPGVIGEYDENGKFILKRENLGGDETTFLPYVVSYPWDIGKTNVFDADYIKLREISLSYRLSKNIVDKLKMEDVNVSLYSRNIMLWTKDSQFGIDPERAFQAESNGGFSQGVERYNVNPWVFPIGFKIGFTF